VRRFDPAAAAVPPRLSEIIVATAARFDLAVDDLTGRRRDRAACMARQCAMLLARDLTHCSLPQIGRAFGRDHTTVIYSLSEAQKRLGRDADYSAAHQGLQRALGVAGPVFRTTRTRS
jgi:chromosomal replication initiation ATPase DnaA